MSIALAKGSPALLFSEQGNPDQPEDQQMQGIEDIKEPLDKRTLLLSSDILVEIEDDDAGKRRAAHISKSQQQTHRKGQ